METHTFIIKDVKPVDINVTLQEVKNTFSKLTFSHLPVFEEDKFIGLISETDAVCFDSQKTLRDYRYAIELFYVSTDTNWLDIIEAFANYNCNIIPVVDHENTYLGYFELSDIMSLFNHTPFLNENGSIIVIEKGSRDYSFSEICQIIESNNGKILGVFISKADDTTTQATIKIGHQSFNETLQTFRRYGYEIISSHQEDKLADSLKERSAYLDKYLNI